MTSLSPTYYVDLNRRMTDDLLNPLRARAMVDALLGMGYGPFDTLGWTLFEQGMDAPTIHQDSLWGWVLNGVLEADPMPDHVPPVLLRLKQAAQEQLVTAGPQGVAMALNHWIQDVWKIQPLLCRQAPMTLITWCLSTAIELTRAHHAEHGTTEVETVQHQVPLAFKPHSGPSVTGWDDEASQVMVQTMMTWSFQRCWGKYPGHAVVKQLLQACDQVGVPTQVWAGTWQKPAVDGRYFPIHANQTAPYLLHLAKSEHWAAVNHLIARLTDPWAVAILERPDQPSLHSHVAALALRQTIEDGVGYIPHDPQRTALLEQFFVAASEGPKAHPTAQALRPAMLEKLLPWLAERQALPEGLSTMERRILNAYERCVLQVPALAGAPLKERTRL